MAQADGVVANGTGSAVRADINGQLAALFTNHSGSTEPATTFAFQTWADTNTSTLKLRNSSNDGWIQLARLDGQFDAKTFNGNITLNAQSDLRLADSDSSNWVAFQAPATVASNVTWTLPATDGTSGQTLQTNGSGTLSWSTPSATVDKIEEGNTSAEVVDTGSDGHFKVITEGTEALRVDSSQRVGIGTTSMSSFNGDFNKLVVGSGSGSNGLIVYSGTSNTGSIAFNDTANTSLSGMVRYDHSSDAMSFWTGGANERLRILSGGGLTFNGDTAAANALDDYEEGTWTPSVGGNATYTTQVGYYVKVGQLVSCYFLIQINAIGSGNDYQIGGLPYTSQSTISTQGSIGFFSGLNANVYWVGLTGGASDTTLYLRCQRALDASVDSNVSLLTSGSTIAGSITYRST